MFASGEYAVAEEVFFIGISVKKLDLGYFYLRSTVGRDKLSRLTIIQGQLGNGSIYACLDMSALSY